MAPSSSPPSAVRAQHRPMFLFSKSSKGSVKRPIIDNFRSSFSLTVKNLFKELQGVLPMKTNVSTVLKDASLRLLDAFVDSTFHFVDHPRLPSQSNFAPVEEIGGMVEISSIEGEIPEDFPKGIYIRNGPNPLFGSLKSTTSIFGRSSHTWVEGDGMLHAVYIKRDREQRNWSVFYRNKYVESETYKLEKGRQKPSFLPAIEGDSPAIIAAYLLNYLRFGKVNKDISNTNVFQHSGKCYAIAENHIPQEIDISTLETLGSWDINGDWDRPFTSHPKKAPGSGELVIIGIEPKIPFLVLGVISADGKRLSHKVDLQLKRSILCHEIGITEKYNVIMDVPLTLDLIRLVRGGPLIKYEEDSYARIGVMPRYGDVDSIKWFDLEPHCMFHILNCFEDGNKVVVRGCRAPWSIVPGLGCSKFELSSQKSNVEPAEEKLFFSCAYEWHLNMETGDVEGKNLTGTGLTIDMPFMNDKFTGLRNAYGYTLVADSYASSECGLPKFGCLAKLHFEEKHESSEIEEVAEGRIKVEYHLLEENQFCSGAVFVSKHGGLKEDDGFIISFVHSEDTNVSQVHIIDAQRFECGPVAKIALPQRVPYGFHGNFFYETISMPVNGNPSTILAAANACMEA